MVQINLPAETKLHLVEPDRQCWHLEIKDWQCTSRHVLGLDFGQRDIDLAWACHIIARIAAALWN